MEEELDNLWIRIGDSTDNDQIILFLNYCDKLIQLKEKGELTEEEAAYKMVGAMQFDSLLNSPVLDAIFDIAGDTEMSRTTSYWQPVGQWDAKTGDSLKRSEWKALTEAVSNAKRSLGLA